MQPATNATTAPHGTTNSASTPRRAASGTRFLDRWASEWEELRRRPEALERARTWELTDEPVDDLEQLIHVLGHGRRSTAETERATRALLGVAVDDQLAARVVIQRILPGLISVARRRARFGQAGDALEELVGVAWIVTRTFNLDRRPTCLAATLIGDINDQTFRAHRRRRRVREESVASVGDFADPSSSDSTAELLSLVAHAAEDGAIDHDDVELVRHLIAERRAVDAAARLDVTARTYRNRRDRLTERLREVALAA